eukprot:COSAG04_NODE_255_length_18797_cov_46.325968_3_plen_117_part_00
MLRVQLTMAGSPKGPASTAGREAFQRAPRLSLPYARVVTPRPCMCQPPSSQRPLCGGRCSTMPAPGPGDKPACSPKPPSTRAGADQLRPSEVLVTCQTEARVRLPGRVAGGRGESW